MSDTYYKVISKHFTRKAADKAHVKRTHVNAMLVATGHSSGHSMVHVEVIKDTWPRRWWVVEK